MSKVYVKTDYRNRIIACDGGYGEPYMNIEEWIFIDEGEGAKYDHCQNGYFHMPITDDRGIYRYKLVDGKPIERTQKEMDDDYAEIPIVPTQLDRIEAQALYTALMTDTLIEEGGDDA